MPAAGRCGGELTVGGRLEHQRHDLVLTAFVLMGDVPGGMTIAHPSPGTEGAEAHAPAVRSRARRMVDLTGFEPVTS